MSTIYPTPTPEAIANAVAAADRMTGLNIIPGKVMPHFWYVEKPDQIDFWTVDTTPGKERCDCPFFLLNGVCAHQKLVDDEIKIRAEEKRIAEEDAGRAEYPADRY